MADADLVLFQKMIFCLGYLGLGYGFARLPYTNRWRGARLDREATITLLLARFAVFFFTYYIAGFVPRSDVVAYFRETEQFLRSFPSAWHISHAYGPLFLAVTSLALKVFYDPKAIIVLAIVFEAAGFWIWLRVGRRGFSESVVRVAALAYLANPFCAVHVAVLGQNRVWISPFLAAAVWLVGHRPFWSGLSFGCSLVLVSFFPAPFLPVFLLAAPAPLAWLGGAFLPLGLSCLSTHVLTTWIAQGRFHMGDPSSANLPFLLTVTGADLTPRVALAIGLLAALSLTAPWVGRYRSLRGQDRDRTLVYAMGVISLIVLISSPKSFPGYLVPTFFPLALATALTARELSPRRTWAVWGGFGVLASLESSLWFAWLRRLDFRMLIPGLAVNPRPWPQLVPIKAWLVFVLEIGLLALYGIFLHWFWRLYKRPTVR